MKLPRRQFLKSAAMAAALPAVSQSAWGQAYPARPVRIVCGFPGGSSQDIVARIVGQWLTQRLGQPVIIDNRPGAGGNIAVEAVVNAPADGYTLLMTGPNNAVNATLYDNLKFVFLRDIAPVALIMSVPLVMEVNLSVPARSVPEFIAYAKANPGKINMASAGNGTAVHVSGELFKMMTGVDMVHVPYRGSPLAMTDLLGGQVQVIFDNMPSVISHIKAGSLRALAVTTAERSAELPDVPTVGETVKDYEASAWFGVGAPKGTPKEIIEKLNTQVNEIIQEPAMKARLAELGGVPMVGTPEDFGKIVQSETDKWEKVVKFSGVKID
jgi:tripartite-type tricarboxylate transporter receptor subunit TctC